MSRYGQFCSVARAHEVLGGRWTLLIVRELLCGSRRFNDIRRGIPRISRTMLAERLQALVHAGVVTRKEAPHGPDYTLTAAGMELMEIVAALGGWGQRWLPRHAASEDIELGPVLVDMHRRVNVATLPAEPLVIRFEIAGHPPHFLLLKQAEASLCTQNPGFPEPLCLRASLPVLTGWWRGDFDFAEARRQGLALDGPKALVRAFPGWFQRYMLAGIPPVAKESSA